MIIFVSFFFQCLPFYPPKEEYKKIIMYFILLFSCIFLFTWFINFFLLFLPQSRIKRYTLQHHRLVHRLLVWMSGGFVLFISIFFNRKVKNKKNSQNMMLQIFSPSFPPLFAKWIIWINRKNNVYTPFNNTLCIL